MPSWAVSYRRFVLKRPFPQAHRELQAKQNKTKQKNPPQFFEVWVFPAVNAGLCVGGPHNTTGHLQKTPGTPAIHFSLVAAGSQSALYKPCRALEKDDWTMRESQAGLNWVLHAEEVGSGICDTMCMNVGARTWARMGSCARRCWAELLCCHGSGLCRGGGALGSRDATVYAEALN